MLCIQQQMIFEVMRIMDDAVAHIVQCMEFSVPQIEYPLGGSSKNDSHVYFLLHVFLGNTIVLSNCTIV